jgi:hypothetical protein
MMLKIDYRLGGIPQYTLVEEGDNLMQIPDEIRKCVVFVCYKTATETKLAGTAFFAGVHLGESNFNSVYVITAKHIIDAIREKSIDQKIYLRINLKISGAQLVKTPIESWLSHPRESNVDVAVLPLAPSQEIFDYLYLPLTMAATQEVIKEETIGVGDDVFLTGLFQNHYGSQQNIPIIRIGNIAAMPEEKVHTEKLGDIDAYLIEARSIGGLSGSPVFVHMGFTRYRENKVMTATGYIYKLLGLMHGHFESSKLELDDLSQDSLTNLKINTGIAIVIPVWKIMEVINQEIFANMRDAALRQEQKKTLPVPDTTTDAASN